MWQKVSKNMTKKVCKTRWESKRFWLILRCYVKFYPHVIKGGGGDGGQLSPVRLFLFKGYDVAKSWRWLSLRYALANLLLATILRRNSRFFSTSLSTFEFTLLLFVLQYLTWGNILLNLQDSCNLLSKGIKCAGIDSWKTASIPSKNGLFRGGLYNYRLQEKCRKWALSP